MPEALIVGAGIGGLAAGLALLHHGWRVRVIERASEVAEVGAGVQISPNGMKVLNALGLGEEIEANGYEPETFNMRLGLSGAPLFSVPIRETFRRAYGAPYIQAHRADLIACLHAALERRAPGSLELGLEASSYSVREGRPHLTLTNAETLSADLLVGADGVRSRLRETMLGPETPRFTGNVAWRAVVDMQAVRDLDPPAGPCVWAGPRRHAVTYPLRGGRLLNFVGIVEQEGWEVESWTEQAPREQALQDFEGWSPLIERILSQAPAHHRWALFDRAPLPRWTDGPVALLGDACHPMLPTLAQGACQAIEDAWTLANAASGAAVERNALPGALLSYAEQRRPRTARIQAGARKMARFFHHDTTLGAFLAYAPVWLAARIAPGLIPRRNGWIYRHDVTRASPASR